MPSSITTTPCPDEECRDGFILVYNIYNKDPLIPEKQICDVCEGKGFIVVDRKEVN